jgi:hypothetical protein
MASIEQSVNTPERWTFRFYINPRRGESRQLVGILQTFCRKFLQTDDIAYDLKIIDVIAQPEIVMRDRILATPTLYFNGGRRAQRIVGTFSSVDHFRLCFINPLRARTTREASVPSVQTA